MIPVTRSRTRTWLPTLLIAVALAATACSAGTGPLGTPASPAVPSTSPDTVSPSDMVPDSPTPAPTPSASPTEAAPGSIAPSASAGSPSPTATPAPTPSPTPAATVVVRAYFLLGSRTGNAGIAPVLRTVPETKGLARAAMVELLGGPKGVELDGIPAFSTAIPDGTRLLDITITDGVASVLLSRDWTAVDGSPAGDIATAQVVYTLTQFTSVDKVRLQVDGEAPRSAQGRAAFRQAGILPAIFVDRPAWGAAAGNPMRLSGIANVFEAQFVVQVLDGKGRVLVEQPVQATCGTGCWGTFRTDLGYDLGKAQYGTLRVFEPSAKDGSPTNVTEYRVWLTPAG